MVESFTNFMDSTVENTDERVQIDLNAYLKTTKKIITTTKQTFVYDFVTYLKDSNAYGNNYFARYFEWQGVCREAWFYNCISKDFLQDIGVFITRKASNEYKKESFPFQKIRCFVNVKDLKSCSFYLTFRFVDALDENVVFSEGFQHIVFADKSRKILRLPSLTLNKMKQYVI